MRRLERLEAGAFDASQFNEWQNRMKSMDANQSLAEIERRRLEGKLSHEQAIIARQNVAKQNRKKVRTAILLTSQIPSWHGRTSPI